ncbi:MAG TPA: helix-turn-helix domain-containing protein [Candidatus Nanopelagicaceae bacterium]|nr:helix-turn-helix domain-containing protein [Candidatus Nanopelagicaceae bacterium]
MKKTAADQLAKKTGDLATAAITRMEEQLPWYSALRAEDRSWVNLVAQRGISAFVEWFAHPGERPQVTSGVFGNAPRELTRSITLEQTVELVRLTISIVETHVADLKTLNDAAAADLERAILIYSREIAFAIAVVYAKAAEERGAWDARLEALIVDGLLRSEPDAGALSRISALGWRGQTPIVVVVGSTIPNGHESDESHATAPASHLRRAAKKRDIDLITAVAGDRLIAILGGVLDPLATVSALADSFGAGPLVIGDSVDSIAEVHDSAQSALSALKVIQAWPSAPRPVQADDLLAERALTGEHEAVRKLVEKVYAPLRGNSDLLATAEALANHTGIEAASRALYVHANTIRYRVRRIAELTGYSPTEPREAFVLNIAIRLGALEA